MGNLEEKINMQNIIGTHDILFVCLDTLRYDVAKKEEMAGNTPVLNQYGAWKKCQAPSNFTYPSHHAMFIGFLPCEYDIKESTGRERLFFPKNIGFGKKGPDTAFTFDGATWIEGLEKKGYQTYCVGGVSFFDKRSDIGKVLPGLFMQSVWKPSFGCRIKKSTEHQIAWIKQKLQKVPSAQRVCLYLNVSAIHYPNYFYVDGEKEDSIRTHAAALRYVDGQLEELFHLFQKRNDTLVICCADHGTCYGEDGIWRHALNHEKINTVPYKHFILRKTID